MTPALSPSDSAAAIRGAIYARKSTDHTHAECDRSVERQVAHARTFAASKGWQVLDEHIYVDDGVSGADFVTRSGFLRLMNTLKKPPPPFHVLVMADGDRLGRSSIDMPVVLRTVCEA